MYCGLPNMSIVTASSRCSMLKRIELENYNGNDVNKRSATSDFTDFSPFVAYPGKFSPENRVN